MATKEKKAAMSKHPKDNQVEKEKLPETPKAKRGRKSAAELAKLSPEQKTPKSRAKRSKEAPSEDGRGGAGQKRLRRSATDQEEPKTPPPGSQKFKKNHLEKELGDLLENATGRNTPSSFPRGRKGNEKEEEGTESGDGLLPGKGKQTDDDNVSVRSFSMSRSKKCAEDDEVSSVKSVTTKSKKGGESAEDDSTLVSSLLRSLVVRPGRKRKSVLAAIAVKKKIFKSRGRPKKILEDGKGKPYEGKKMGKMKVGDKNLGEKQKRVIKKPLKFQNKIKDQTRLQKLKNGNIRKTKLKISVKKQKEGEGADEGGNERLNEAEGGAEEGSSGKKKLRQKRKKKEEDLKGSLDLSDGSDKPNDVYFFTEGETSLVTSKKRPKLVKLSKEKARGKKSVTQRKKKKRESGIHFETTRSPDDSSVMIVQPRLGPKIKGQRLKPILPKTDELSKAPKDVGLPNPTGVNFNQMSSSYFLQSIPNFNLFSANSILRNLNSNSISMRPNVNDTFCPKASNNEIIVTPSGIVLSGSRFVSSNSQHSLCFNGSGSNFLPEPANGELVFAAKEGLDNISGLIYQSNTTVIQPQPTRNTAIFLKRPEAMSTSLISATSGAFVFNSSGNTNGGLKVKVCNTPSDTIASEKALEGDATNRFKITPTNSNVGIPSIPVAKNVSDLIMLKRRSIACMDTQVSEDQQVKKEDVSLCNGRPQPFDKLSSVEYKLKDTKPPKIRRRELRNVRHLHGSGSELTFSEPEISSCELDEVPLFKTKSCERVNKPVRYVECKQNVLLQLGSEPMTMSDVLAPFETTSVLLTTKKEKIEEKLEMGADSPEIKGAVDVCRFSKENEKVLKEFGLDSDLDQGKHDTDGDSPVKMTLSVADLSKQCRLKDQVDHVLKETPNRKTSNCPRKSEPFKITASRMELKSPLLHKNEYLTLSPSKPPTVIDKLLEKNKSLKKAEEEGKFQNAIRDLTDAYGVVEVKPRRALRETRTRKYHRVMESRRVAHKKLASGGKMYERRGSNPEIYSEPYLTAKNQVANENVPLRRVTDPGDGKFQRRGSIDFDSIQKVLDRRCSLPAPAEEIPDPLKLSKSLDDVNKIKTENVKTIIVGTSKPLTSKNREFDVQPRVINIVTNNCGLKKGKNLMKEIGLVNGEGGCERRPSAESYNSDSESLQKLVDGLSREKSSKEVPYYGEKSRRARLSIERKSPEKERKAVVIEESPEDLVTKETILSALGLQSLKAAAQSAQKKKDSQSNQQNNCQTENGGYTGTLKAVIKIQRQEKKGNSKSPIKMVYKASSSSSSVSGQMEDSNNFDETETGAKEEVEENNSEDNKNGNGKAKSLVIPEKASSFSIHPGRMCSDVCTYCFGKFGLLDTPCHIAQLKDADKRRNILATEVHLTADSCLCDACFRHVDKKSNYPTLQKQDIRKRSVRKQSCIVQNCNAESQHSIKRKLFLKLKKSVGRKVILDAGKLEKLQPGQSLTFCNRHIYWIDYFMSCGICKKRLTSVNMYRVTSEVLELNAALSSDEIPAILTENRFLCKICNCFASIRLKCKDPNEMSSSHRQFYETCRKRILKCHGMDVPDSEPEGDGKSGTEHKRRSKKSSKPTATVTNENSKSDNDMEVSVEEIDKTENEKDLSEVSHMNIPPKTNGNLDFGGVSITPASTEVNPTQIHVKLGNLNIGALGNLNIGQDVRHGGARGGDIQCFPTEAELALRAHFDLNPSAEDESAKAARKGFEKCTTTIQFSPETKNLFYNLQMPYGNMSSFFRHLILLEKYFRSGDLVIARNADPKAVSYISSVQNRIRSYEGVHLPTEKAQDVPSLSILPQPILKAEGRGPPEGKPSVIPSRPFTLTPMPSSSSFLKNSPLSQIQATVQNIQPSNPSQGIMTSLLKSSVQTSKFASHPKPEVSITSVSADGSPPVRLGKASVLTSKIQENLRNLASKSQAKQSNPARAIILNRTVGGQKQSLVQVTTGGKTIHLTLSQFRRIQQMQMKKKQYLEHQAKMLKGKDEQTRSKSKRAEEGLMLKNLSPELEIQEVKQKPNGSPDVFPLISEVRSLAGEETSWGPMDPDTSGGDFPKIPKTLSVSVTKVYPPDYSAKEQSVEPVE